MSTVVGMYTEYFMRCILVAMEENKYESAIDTAGTLWHIDDVRRVLQYYEKGKKTP